MFKETFQEQRLRTPIQVENCPAQSTLCDLNTRQGTCLTFSRGKSSSKLFWGGIALWSTESDLCRTSRSPTTREAQDVIVLPICCKAWFLSTSSNDGFLEKKKVQSGGIFWTRPMEGQSAIFHQLQSLLGKISVR